MKCETGERERLLAEAYAQDHKELCSEESAEFKNPPFRRITIMTSVFIFMILVAFLVWGFYV